MKLLQGTLVARHSCSFLVDNHPVGQRKKEEKI